MASQSKVVSDVRSAIAQGRIGGRNPISTLCAKTGYDSPAGRKLVEAAIYKLRRDGEVVIDTERGKIVSVYQRSSGPRYADRTEMSVNAKREARFAKGVPAHLTDDMVTPVVITYVEPTVVFSDAQPEAEKEEPVSESSPTPSAPDVVSEDADMIFVKTEPYHQTLTKCLHVLQKAADSSGLGEGLSVRKVLMQMVDMTNSRATRAMLYLQGMNLYATSMIGFQRSSYVVETGITEVTPEMVKRYSDDLILRKTATPEVQSVSEQGSETDAAPTVETVTEAEPPTTASEGAAEPPSSPIDSLSRLLDVVEGLERELASLHSEVGRLKTDLSDVNEQRDRLSAEHAAQQTVIDDLDRQLREAQAENERLRRKPVIASPIDARIQGILARHTS